MAHSKFFNGSLYQQMSDDLHLAGVSQRTHDGYLRATRQLADYCGRSPDEIDEQQLRRYFLHLKNERHFATGSMRVAFSGIKFFYTRSCKREWQTLATMKIQNVKSLPDVLTIPQVHRIIDACTVGAHRHLLLDGLLNGFAIGRRAESSGGRCGCGAWVGPCASRQRSQGSLRPVANLDTSPVAEVLVHSPSCEIAVPSRYGSSWAGRFGWPACRLIHQYFESRYVVRTAATRCGWRP